MYILVTFHQSLDRLYRKVTDGTVFDRHVQAVEPPTWDIIAPPFTVEFCWPIFKNHLRNKKVAVSALRQIEFSGVSAADEDSGLEQLFVEQRFEEIADILKRIDADKALGKIEALKSEIRP